MEKYIDDNWKISSNFPAEYKTEVLCNEKNVICREVEFSYAPEKEQQTERKIMVEFSFPVLDISGRWYPAVSYTHLFFIHRQGFIRSCVQISLLRFMHNI